MAEADFHRKREEFWRSLELSQGQLEDYKLDADSSVWNHEMYKRIPASFFGEICKMWDTTHCKNYVKRILYTDHNEVFENERKPNAKQELADILYKEVEDCGLFIDPEDPYLCATPDALIGTDCIVYITCPRKCARITPLEAIRYKKIHYAIERDGEIILKRSSNLYFEVQGQLHVTRRKVCYFVIWTRQGLEFEKIHRDDQFWSKKCQENLRIFYEYCLLPELIEPLYPNQKKIRDLRPGFGIL